MSATGPMNGPPPPVRAARGLVYAAAALTLVVGLMSRNNTAAVLVTGLSVWIGWGIGRGKDAARIGVWVFAGLAASSFLVGLFQLGPLFADGAPDGILVGVDLYRVLRMVADLVVLAAGVLIAGPAARDFFLANRKPSRVSEG